MTRTPVFFVCIIFLYNKYGCLGNNAKQCFKMYIQNVCIFNYFEHDNRYVLMIYIKMHIYTFFHMISLWLNLALNMLCAMRNYIYNKSSLPGKGLDVGFQLFCGGLAARVKVRNAQWTAMTGRYRKARIVIKQTVARD